MATVPFTIESLKTFGDTGHIITWSGITNGSDGSPLEMVGSADRSVQIEGTFGGGGTVLIEGSNDGTNYRILHDPSITALSLTAAQIAAVLEISAFIRPRVSAGDGSTSLTVILLVRRPT